jgi:hypothetical protein
VAAWGVVRPRQCRRGLKPAGTVTPTGDVRITGFVRRTSALHIHPGTRPEFPEGRGQGFRKSHLHIKAFFGTSENAVKTQVWIAMSVHVLIAILRKRMGLEHLSLCRSRRF